MASRAIVFFLILFISSNLLANTSSENIKVFESNKSKAQVVVLDKITSKKTTHNLNIDTNYPLQSLEILVKRCILDNSEGSLNVLAYVQVQDSVQKKNKDKVFLFNGWMMSKYPSINPFENSNFDIWILNCS
jgi:hypothetical protein